MKWNFSPFKLTKSERGGGGDGGMHIFQIVKCEFSMDHTTSLEYQACHWKTWNILRNYRISFISTA